MFIPPPTLQGPGSLSNRSVCAQISWRAFCARRQRLTSELLAEREMLHRSLRQLLHAATSRLHHNRNHLATVRQALHEKEAQCEDLTDRLSKAEEAKERAKQVAREQVQQVRLLEQEQAQLQRQQLAAEREASRERLRAEKAADRSSQVEQRREKVRQAKEKREEAQRSSHEAPAELERLRVELAQRELEVNEMALRLDEVLEAQARGPATVPPTSSSAAASSTAPVRSSRVDAPQSAPECVVCLSDAPSHAFLPCGHLCCCNECSNAILQAGVRVPSSLGAHEHGLYRQADITCPLCKRPVQSRVQIFV